MALLILILFLILMAGVAVSSKIMSEENDVRTFEPRYSLRFQNKKSSKFFSKKGKK